MIRKLQNLCMAVCGVFLMTVAANAQSSFYDLEATSIDGAPVKLSEYKGKVLLIVNVASRCGYTPQYEGLQNLYNTYRDQGFVVLGFPSNDFGGQEPGTEAEIKAFCSSKFGANFPLFSKVAVVGAAKHPVYQFLTQSTGGREVGWNFEKFLVDRSGRVAGRFPSSVAPASSELTTAISAALKGS
jgi:glutathione peroxidase